MGDWLAGHLTTNERIWGALFPLLALLTYFVGGLLVYGVRCLRIGTFKDGEMSGRPDSVFLGMWIRQYFAWVIQPVWATIRRSGIPANAVTKLSFLLALAAGLSIAAGRFSLGGWLYIFSGILDYLDGRIARFRGEDSPRGAALDSILDRYSDSAVFFGLVWFYRDSWVLIPVLVAFVGGSIVPYVRAKGESLGIPSAVGLMQRAERIVCLGGALALSPILEALMVPQDAHPIHRLAVFGIIILAISSQFTAAMRMHYLLNRLDPELSHGEIDLNWHRRRHKMIKNIVAAIVATGLDFGVVLWLIYDLGLNPWQATACGVVVGAVLNFSLNRYWTFDRHALEINPPVAQGMRYVLVSTTSALLNSGGVAIFLLLPEIDFKIGWVVTRIAVYLAWNYPLQKGYVFEPKKHRVDTSKEQSVA